MSNSYGPYTVVTGLGQFRIFMWIFQSAQAWPRVFSRFNLYVQSIWSIFPYISFEILQYFHHPQIFLNWNLIISVDLKQISTYCLPTGLKFYKRVKQRGRVGSKTEIELKGFADRAKN